MILSQMFKDPYLRRIFAEAERRDGAADAAPQRQPPPPLLTGGATVTAPVRELETA